jgi:acetyl esterase/lipase
MNRPLKLWVCVSCLFLAMPKTYIAEADEPIPIAYLWEGRAPGATGDEETDRPKLQIWLPKEPSGTGIVVCPGGGYGGLAMGHEGKDVAEWLNRNGIAAFVLDYRHRGKGYGNPAPLLDVQRAMRTARAKAKEWKVEPNRLGVLGFSAGGHLASSISTHFDKGNPHADDAIDRVSCRPDFAVLVYPVISFTTEYTHQGSKKNLLGENPDEELVKSFSNELQVTAETPPTFMMHTNEDDGVPPENSVLYYMALRKAKVPAELHIFQHGRHGLGLAPGQIGLSKWPDLCIDWMKGRGVLGTD